MREPTDCQNRKLAPEQLPVSFNIVTALVDENITRGFGERPAFYFEDSVLTYDQLSIEVNKVGNLLARLSGVHPEARVTLLMPDCPEFVTTALAIMKIGAVVVPLSTMLRPDEYVYMLNDTRASVLVVHAAFLDLLSSVAESLRYLKHLLVVGDWPRFVSIGKLTAVDYHESAKLQPHSLSTALTNRDDSAFWVYTSGSTGRPKGTVHLQHDIYYAAHYLNRYFYDITETDVVYSASKLFFAYGFGNSFWIPMFSGAAAVLEPQRSTPEVVLSNIAKYRPSRVFAVPTIYKSVCEYLGANNEQAGACRRVERYYSAGEPLSKTLYEKWVAVTGREILTVLGSTEALQGYVGAWPGMGSPGCLGKTIPGYQAKIVDDQGQLVPPGDKGVLMVRGDSIASCYWNRHKESQRAFRGKWLYTGDVVKEQDGILWYVGRNDEMLKVAGQWVSPVEIEEVLNTHPAVRENAVIGCSDENGLMALIAYVVRKTDAIQECSEDSILEFLQARVPSRKCPRAVRFLDELPRSSTGKLQKFKLKELYNAEREASERTRQVTVSA